MAEESGHGSAASGELSKVGVRIAKRGCDRV